MTIVIIKVLRVHHLPDTTTVANRSSLRDTHTQHTRTRTRTHQIRSQLKEQTKISMEQVIRLSLLILGYWLVYAYVIGYRIYLEAVRVPSLAF